LGVAMSDATVTITVSSNTNDWIEYWQYPDSITLPTISSNHITFYPQETYPGTFIYIDEAGTYTPEAAENVMMGVEQYKKGEQMEFTFVRQMKM
jgi:hypothetical protein